ncbi:MAG TPA: ABC transporter substrate-binding protein [Candidatus Acidoferrum sp.]|jgi:putative ABC transport system substrate-binding protein|nr:ABC transporter substrate-binding protein [Candidatus Acidoferrum sp.]
MNRRAFIGAVAGSLLARPRSAAAQPTGRVYRVGVLSPGAPSTGIAAFGPGIRRLGWVPGQNLIIEQRYARGDLARLPALAAELVALKVDVILVSSVAIPAARAATRTIPTVMTFAVDDPVEEGWVASLARPGGNLTGVTLHAPELTGKRLELLKVVLPGMRRVGVLAWPRPGGLGQVRAAEAAARSLSLQTHVVEVQETSQYEGALDALKREGADALLVLSSSAFFAERRRIADLAVKHRLPLVAPFREVAEAGGLMAYGPNIAELWGQRVPVYVDRILKGARPGDLPIEQPTKYELVVNLKTAKALGLVMPQSFLLRADQVIE